MSTPYAAAETDRPTYPEVKAEHGEDPARFLAVDENDPNDDHPLALAHARIKAIDSLEYLKEWQRIEADNWGRKSVMKHLYARERELTDDELAETPTPEASADPVPATDGGTPVEYDETEPEQIHPDARRLEAGEALVVDRGEKIEYVFPTNAKSDSPYISRAYEADTDNLWMELEIDEEDYRSRLAKDPDHESIDEIDVEVPRKAATGGEE